MTETIGAGTAPRQQPMRLVRLGTTLAMVVILAGCWTMPGAGPERSGNNPFETGLTTANVASLEPDWTWQADWPTWHAVSDPIASPGGVHASVGHKLVTLDPESGAERWRAVLFDAGAAGQFPISAGAAAYEDGRVFVSVGVYRNVVPGAGTHSYDAITGEALGTVARGAAEVAVPRDGRIIGTYGDVIGSGVGLTGYFVTDRHDPDASWDAHLSAGGLDAAPTSPAVGPDAFYLSFGTSLRSYPIAEPAGCINPVPSSPFLLCPPRWTQSFGAGLTRPVLTRAGQTLIVGDAGRLNVLEAASGAPVWTGRLSTTEAPSAPPAVNSRRVFVPVAGRLATFNADGCGRPICNPQWKAELGGTVSLQPAVAGRVVYTATTEGLLRAFSAAGCGAATCAALWEHDLGVEITGAPAVSNGRLYVGTADGRLVSFAPTL